METRGTIESPAVLPTSHLFVPLWVNLTPICLGPRLTISVYRFPGEKVSILYIFFFRWAKATVTNVRERRPVISGPFQFSVLFFRCLNKLLLHLNWARSGCEDDRWCWMRARILHYANEVANDSGNRPQFIGIQQLRLASGSQLIIQEGSTEWLPIELN